MSKVTEKQEKFLQNIVYKGMSQREAYKDAYPNTRAKDKRALMSAPAGL